MLFGGRAVQRLREERHRAAEPTRHRERVHQALELLTGLISKGAVTRARGNQTAFYFTSWIMVVAESSRPLGSVGSKREDDVTYSSRRKEKRKKEKEVSRGSQGRGTLKRTNEDNKTANENV